MAPMLSRAKIKDTKEWVVGYYACESNHACTQGSLKYTHYIFRDEFMDWNIGGLVQYIVDPDTVGRDTGLVDKNGNHVFEGDIVEGHLHSAWHHDVMRCVVAYGRNGFESRHYLNYKRSDSHYYAYKVLYSGDVVVIGNIHDNPELL